jgi:hypothetical protein
MAKSKSPLAKPAETVKSATAKPPLHPTIMFLAPRVMAAYRLSTIRCWRSRIAGKNPLPHDAAGALEAGDTHLTKFHGRTATAHMTRDVK